MLWQLSSTAFSSVLLMVLKPTLVLIPVALYAERTIRTCQEEEWMEIELWRAFACFFFQSELPRRRKSRVCAGVFIPGRGHWWRQCAWKSSSDYSANVHLLPLLLPHFCSLSLLLIMASPQLSFFFLFFTSETIQFPFPGDVWGHCFDSDELQKWENQTFILTALPLLPLGLDHQDHSRSSQGLITELCKKGDPWYWNYCWYHKIFWLLLAAGPDPVSTTCRPPISSMGVPQAGVWGLPAPLRSV